ncbi:Release factor glutamine methyltransferase [Poriferisphaera corsica]|uniref:Release factor glutamine methyltransferase n=1 Tax=Poriferisphaera corsica TaxID=2528020 RepID=A0A517YPL5_9BACT|nr:peptide chain release factor N(5)-glutamine methyltransferase [Poriferisphaera corsica]QDU32159.1 Release factor glutamine methyltransferase [Poriferisphaera corsica]
MNTVSTWTTSALLRWTTQHFEKKSIDHPRLSAEMLLAYVIGCERLRLYMDPDRPASELERATLRTLVERASEHEPVDYLVGHAPFFSMMFDVTRDTLIPRPSTETLVEHVIQHARVTPGFTTPLIADICTGSGIIAICLAKHIKDARVIATDISAPALEVAKRNAEKHDVADRIDFRLGNLLEPLQGERFHYLCSNPPYIPDNEWDVLDRNVKEYEPEIALRGGPDGLDFLTPLITQGRDLLYTPGQIVLEIAAAHNRSIQQLADGTNRYANTRVLPDHEALPRILIADTI